MEQMFSNEPVYSNDCSPGNMKRSAREPRAYCDLLSPLCSTVANQTKAKQGTQHWPVIQIFGIHC